MIPALLLALQIASVPKSRPAISAESAMGDGTWLVTTAYYAPEPPAITVLRHAAVYNAMLRGAPLVSGIEPNVARVMDDADKQGPSRPEEPGTLKESGELDESFSNPSVPKTANQQIRHLTDTAFVYSLVLGGDLISTQVCLNRNPRCEEKNPLLFNSDVSLAAKIMITGAAVFVDYRLYTGSHPKGASWLRRVVVVAGIGIIASNFVTAFQK